jgi:hypothetical protein
MIDFVGGVRNDDGSVWLAGGNYAKGRSEIWRGRFDRSFSENPVVSTPLGDGFKRIDAPRTSSAVSDVYALTADGQWLRFDGGTVQRLASLPVLQDGSTLRLGPSEALVSATSTTNLRRYKNGVVTEEVVGLGREPFMDLAITPFGLTVVSATGSFYVERGGTWSRLGQTGLSPDYSPRSIVAYGDGFVFAGFGGYVGQFLPGTGPCNVGVQSPNDLQWVITLGRDLLIGGDAPADASSPVSLVLLRRQ